MRIKAIIVTFNPKANVVNLINNLKRQNVTPIIVDNGSINFDFKIIENDLDCYLIRLYENFGIATAQNKGIEKALELGTDYILFFDQDSTISDNFVNDILNDYSFLSRKNITIGALGPRFIDERNKFYYKSIGISKYGLRTKYDVSNISEPFHSYLLISSGSLVSVDTLKNVGLMRDKYFIDYVDTEWCIRADLRDITIICLPKQLCIIQLGIILSKINGLRCQYIHLLEDIILFVIVFICLKNLTYLNYLFFINYLLI